MLGCLLVINSSTAMWQPLRSPLSPLTTADDENLHFQQCLNAAACQAGGICSPGHEGDMCGVCSPRHYRTAAMSCEQCGATSQLTLVLGMLLAVSIVGVAIHMGQRGASKPSSMTSVLQKIYFNTAQVQRSNHSRD